MGAVTGGIIVSLPGLYVVGWLPFLKPPTGPGGEVSFSFARTLADALAGGTSGPYPNLSQATGLVSRDVLSVPTTLVEGGCPLVAVPGGSSTITVPAVLGTLAPGMSPFWLFVYAGKAGLLIVTVTNGQAQEQGTVSASSPCASAWGIFPPVPPGVIDSTYATATINANGGSAYLVQNPRAGAIYGILDAPSGASGAFNGSTWLVLYTLCSLAPGSRSPAAVPAFEGVVNASTGRLEVALPVSPACGAGNATIGPAPLGSALALGSPSVATTGPAFWYNMTVASAAPGLTTADLGLQVQSTSGGVVVPQPSWMVGLEDITGATLASYSLSTGTWSTPTGAAVTLTRTMEVTFHTTQALNGDLFVVVGMGNFTGSISVLLP